MEKQSWAEEKAWKEVAFREFLWILLLYDKNVFLLCLLFSNILSEQSFKRFSVKIRLADF